MLDASTVGTLDFEDSRLPSDPDLRKLTLRYIEVSSRKWRVNHKRRYGNSFLSFVPPMLFSDGNLAERWFLDRVAGLTDEKRCRAFSDMKRFLVWMTRHRPVPGDLIDFFEPPKRPPTTTPEVYTSDECERLLAWVWDDSRSAPGHGQWGKARTPWKLWHYGACELLLLHCGLRRSEMSELRVREIDLLGGALWLSPGVGRDLKTGNSRRQVPLSSTLVSTLAICINGLDPDDRVFPGAFRVGQAMEISKATGVAFSGRKCRRTFATALASADLPSRILTIVMGHGSVGTTDKHYWGRSRPVIPGLELEKFWQLDGGKRRYDTRGVFEKDAS